MLRYSCGRRGKKKNDKLATLRPTVSAAGSSKTKQLEWRNTKIRVKPSSRFLDATVSPISTDSPEFTRALIASALSVRQSDGGTLWRWKLTRSSPEQVLSILSDDPLDRAKFLPIQPTPKPPKLVKLDKVGFSSLPSAVSDYLTEWLAFERSGQNDLLAFIGTETAAMLLESAATARNSADLLCLSRCLQGALILGATLTSRADQMALSMAHSLWAFLQVAHSQIHDKRLDKKRVWSLLNGLTAECGGSPSGMGQVISFLKLTLPVKGKMKDDDKRLLVQDLRRALIARGGSAKKGDDDAAEVEKRWDEMRRLSVAFGHLLDDSCGWEGTEEGRGESGKKAEPMGTPIVAAESTRNLARTEKNVKSVEKKSKGRGGRPRQETTGEDDERRSSSLLARVRTVAESEQQPPYSTPRIGNESEEEEAAIQQKKKAGVMERGRSRQKKLSRSANSWDRSRSPPFSQVIPAKQELRESASPARNKKQSTSPNPHSRVDRMSLDSEWTDYFEDDQGYPSTEKRGEATTRERSDGSNDKEKSEEVVKQKGIKVEPRDHFPKSAKEDEEPSTSRKHWMSEDSDAETRTKADAPTANRSRAAKAKPPGDEVLGKVSQLRKERGEESDGEMGAASASSASRPKREKKPAKIYDPTPKTAKKRSVPSGERRAEQPEVTRKMPRKEIVDMSDIEDESEEEMDDMRRVEEWLADTNMAEADPIGQEEQFPLYLSEMSRPRTIRNTTPEWSEIPFQMPALVSVEGVIREGERTKGSVGGRKGDEGRMEEGGETGEVTDQRDGNSGAATGCGEEGAIAEEIDAVDVDGKEMEKAEGERGGEIGPGVIADRFEVDDDVEKMHEILEEAKGEEAAREISDRVCEGEKEKETGATI